MVIAFSQFIDPVFHALVRNPGLSAYGALSSAGRAFGMERDGYTVYPVFIEDDSPERQEDLHDSRRR